jgi:hypothetical protein
MCLSLFFPFPHESAKHSAHGEPHIFGNGFESPMLVVAQPERDEPSSFGHGVTVYPMY